MYSPSLERNRIQARKFFFFFFKQHQHQAADGCSLLHAPNALSVRAYLHETPRLPRFKPHMSCHTRAPPPTHPPLLLLPERFFPNWRNLWRYFIVGEAFCGSFPLSLRLSAQPSDYPHVGTVIVRADLCSLTVNRCSIQPINKFIKVSAGFRHRALSSPE